MNTTPNKLAETIRREFRASGWSIKRLADESGVPYSSTYRFLKDKTSIDLSTADRLCRVLVLELRPRRNARRRTHTITGR